MYMHTKHTSNIKKKTFKITSRKRCLWQGPEDEKLVLMVLVYKYWEGIFLWWKDFAYRSIYLAMTISLDHSCWVWTQRIRLLFFYCLYSCETYSLVIYAWTFAGIWHTYFLSLNFLFVCMYSEKRKLPS